MDPIPYIANNHYNYVDPFLKEHYIGSIRHNLSRIESLLKSLENTNNILERIQELAIRYSNLSHLENILTNNTLYISTSFETLKNEGKTLFEKIFENIPDRYRAYFLKVYDSLKDIIDREGEDTTMFLASIEARNREREKEGLFYIF